MQPGSDSQKLHTQKLKAELIIHIFSTTASIDIAQECEEGRCGGRSSEVG